MVEFALVFPLALAVVLLAFNAEWSVFQAQELRDAANGAVHATTLNGPDNNPPDIVAGCDNHDRILNAIRQSAAVLPIPASAHLCIPPPDAAGVTHSDVLLYQSGNLSICITADPTIYIPSHVTAVVTDQLSALGPINLFHLTVSSTSENTIGPTGIPGTGSASPDPICPKA